MGEEQHQGRFKNTKKNTRKGKTIKKKTNGNTIERKGGRFDSLEAALRERSNTKVGSKTRGRTPGKSRPLGRTPSVTQQKKKIHQKWHQGR